MAMYSSNVNDQWSWWSLVIATLEGSTLRNTINKVCIALNSTKVNQSLSHGCICVFVYLCFSSHSALCTGDVVGCNELWRILPQPITSPTSTTYLLMVRTLWRSGNYQGCCFQWRGCSDNFHFLKKWCEPYEKQFDVGKMYGAEVKLQNAASKQEGRWRWRRWMERWRGRTEGGGGQNWMATVRARLGETKPS